MGKFTVLTGESYEVEAEDSDKAMEVFFAWWNEDPCPCGSEECGCVEEGEALTEVIN